jgi:hypothetical protein
LLSFKVSPQVVAAFNHKHFSPQVAIAKMGLEKQPHFHKATWVQSTSVFWLAEVCIWIGLWNYVVCRCRCASILKNHLTVSS